MPAADPSYEGQARVYRKQGATAQVIASGGTIEVQSGGIIDVTSGLIRMPANLAKGVIQLDIFSARALSSAENFLGASVSATGGNLGNAIGGLLNVNSTPTLTMNSTVNNAAVLTWASGVQAAIAFPPVSIPMDFSSAGGLEMHFQAEHASDNASNNVLDLRFWANLNATEQGSTGATLTTVPADYTVTVSSAEVGSYPGFWNLQVVPGTHTNNSVKVYSGFLRYTKLTS